MNKDLFQPENENNHETVMPAEETEAVFAAEEAADSTDPIEETAESTEPVEEADPADAGDAAETIGNAADEKEEEAEAVEQFDRKEPDLFNGLSAEDVRIRTARGAVNTPVDAGTVTFGTIVRRNVLTYFNLIFLVIAICLCLVGSFRDLTFLPIIIANTCIGIFQEWRSKRLLDRLTIITSPKVKVIRDGKQQEIPCEELVIDDLVIFEPGNQISADAIVMEGELSVNESLLTGEADEIAKKPGDQLLSGSFVISGTCRARLDKVGADSYVSKLTLEAKQGKRGEESEMIRSLDRLVKVIGILIIPIAGILFWQQYFIAHQSVRASVTATVAAVLGMIPEGLYLLASVALAVSAMRLAMGKVLIQSMKSIETLARADVLCVDKTGTITENVMVVKEAIPFAVKAAQPAAAEEGLSYSEDVDNLQEEGYSPEELAALELMLGDFAACMSADNATIKAIRSRFTRQTGKRPEKIFPFSSVHKYSGAVFGNRNFILGAPEFILREQYPVFAQQIEKYAILGYRVLVLADYKGELNGDTLTKPVQALGMVLLTNPVRDNAPETFRYFAQQGVEVKVISGDNPLTVSEVASQAQIPGAEHFVDASQLSDEELEAAVEENVVFGRVTPQQKRVLIHALKKKGHTVAMTGDGVNDVLALKDADCSIAMASGAEAARNAAQMVLLESDFARMPSVVAEGRRVVNNIERTASLFLVKNIFSLLMSLFSIVFMLSYPLEPSQISLISMFTIGIPAFVMSLERNEGRISGHFMSNVSFRALPAGLTDFAVISALVIFCQEFKVSETDMSTSCTILLAIVGIMILYRIACPMTKFHMALWLTMIAGIIFCMTIMHKLFAITALSEKTVMLLVIFAIVTEPTLRYLSMLIKKIWAAAGWIKRKFKEQKAAEEQLFADIK